MVAPSGPVDPSRLERGVRFLEGQGLVPVIGQHVLDRQDYLAGPDEARLEDLQAALDDEELGAIICARGGFGLTRIVDRLDLDPLLRSPRWVVGFSDATPLLLAAASRADVAPLYGPMAASNFVRDDFRRQTLQAFRIAVGLDEGELIVDRGAGTRFLGPEASVTAPVVGGCLSLLTASLATPIEIGTDGAILFWEDVGEELFRLDRLLTHLKSAGKLERLAGMIVGVGVAMKDRGRPVEDLTPFLEAWLGEVPFPVVTQFPCGHGEPLVSIPLHRLATIDPSNGRVVFHR